MNEAIIRHYDMLIDMGNDPVQDPAPLREYMDKWDGDTFVHLLGLTGTQRVLEIGIGTGRLALRIAPLCASLCGIDLSPKTILRAADNLSQFGNITLLQGDFLTYSFSRQFNVIYSSLTFMHIRDKAAAIGKVAELLQPGGRFVLSIDKNPADYIDIGTNRIAVFPDHPEKIAEHLTTAGLTLSETAETEFAYILFAEKQ